MVKEIIVALEEMITQKFDNIQVLKKTSEIKHPQRDVFYLGFVEGNTKDLGMFGQREIIKFRIVYLIGHEKKSSEENRRFIVYDKLMKILSKGFLESKERMFCISNLKGGDVQELDNFKIDTEEDAIYLDVTFTTENKREIEEENGVIAKKLKLKY